MSSKEAGFPGSSRTAAGLERVVGKCRQRGRDKERGVGGFGGRGGEGK